MTQQDKEIQPESAETTPTRFVHVREVRFAYRRFGNPARTPLILLQHFRGSMTIGTRPCSMALPKTAR